MKRFFSAALALMLAFSVLTSAAVVSAADGGREGDIVVLLRDFENGSKLSTDVGNIVDVREDMNGNHFGAVMMAAETIQSVPLGDENRVFSLFENRANIKLPFSYISGKTYSISWKLGKIEKDKISPITKGTSGIESMSGGALLTYKNSSGTWVADGITQWYDTGRRLGADSTATPGFNAANDENGWKVNTFTNIAYPLCVSSKDTTPLGEGKSATVVQLFFSMSDVYNDMVNLLIENQAYCGKGIVDGSKKPLTNSFKLDEDHVYGDEACFSDEESEYYGKDKSALVGTTWTLGQDCTGLKSATRTAKFKEAVAAFSNFSYGIDDVKVTAKAMLYDNTVTAGKNGKVLVTTTNPVGDAAVSSAAVSGETKSIEVNDYYGTTYEVKPDDGYEIASVTYGGEAITLTDGKFTVAPADVAADKEFKAEFYKIPGVKVRSFKVELKGGTTGDKSSTNNGKYIESKDGKLIVSANANGTDNIVNSEEGYFEWQSAKKSGSQSRMYIHLPGTKIGAGRKIQLAYDMSNGGTSAFGMPYVQMSVDSVFNYKDNTAYGSNSRPYAAVGSTAAQVHIYGPGVSIGGSVPAAGSATINSPVYSYISFTSTDNTETCEYNEKAYQKNVHCEFVVNNSADTVAPRLHAVTFTETVPVYEFTAEQNDASGSVKLYSDSLNFGVDNDNIEIADGTAAEVEHMMTAKFTVKAPSGKVIDKVEFADDKGNTTDYSASLANEASGELSIAETAIGGTLKVTYKQQTVSEPTVSASDFSAVTTDFSYIPTGSETAVTVSGKNSIITYAKIEKGTYTIKECGFYLAKTNSDGSTSAAVKLSAIAVPEGTTYGIRAFGNALTAGQYSVQPYVIKDDGTEIKGEEKTLTIS